MKNNDPIIYSKLTAVAVVCLTLVLSGCVVGKIALPPPSKMIQKVSTETPITKYALGSVSVKAGRDGIMPTPYAGYYQEYTQEEVTDFIRATLVQNNLFGDDTSSSLNVEMQIIRSGIGGPVFGPTEGYIDARYVVTNQHGDEVLNQVIETSLTDSTFAGDTRMNKARVRALQKNIFDFVDALRAKLSDYDLMVVLRQESEAKIKENLEAINTHFRVVNDQAVVRNLPDGQARKIETYPSGSVVHIIGKLPSGWLQVAKEGKPFGWVYVSGLRPEQGGGSGVAGAAVKPSLFIAYPKGGEEIADDHVDLLGYVTAANKTRVVKMFINKKRQFVDEMWRHSPIVMVGLRGFPLDFKVPLQAGRNEIELQVLDEEGYMVNSVVTVKRISLQDEYRHVKTDLSPRQPDIGLASHNRNITTENFMAVLGNWVKETAKSDYNKGNAMFDQGRYERAAYYYRKALKTDKLMQAYFNLGLAEIALGHDQAAQKSISKACAMGNQTACEMTQ